MPRQPAILTAYRAFARLSPPLWRLALSHRAGNGKEDPARLPEKYGHPSAKRPGGPLIWFHAVSVGESLALLKLLRKLRAAHPELGILLTTTTLGSVKALDKTGLPEGVIHQYFPIDTPAAVARFLDHWRPDLHVIAEADMWPLMMSEVRARGVPMILLNTTITPRRFRQRMRGRALYAHLFGYFDALLMQDQTAIDRFIELGAPKDRLHLMGVLKSASDPLPVDADELTRLQGQIGARPVWLAAVTTPDEEDALIAAHAIARARIPDLLLMIAPRQVHLADKTVAAARVRFAHVARRSRAEVIKPKTDVYIADTIGEMGLWYRLSPIAFMGHSMPASGQGMSGKNPYEAIALDRVVLHGPTHENFVATYDYLAAQGAVVPVANAQALGEAVVALQSPEARAPYMRAMAKVRAEAARPLEIAFERLSVALENVQPSCQVQQD